MEQINLFDWLEGKKVILELPPSEVIKHRTFIIEQLKPIFAELEALNIANSSISEAMAYYQNIYQNKTQKAILKLTE